MDLWPTTRPPNIRRPHSRWEWGPGIWLPRGARGPMIARQRYRDVAHAFTQGTFRQSWWSWRITIYVGHRCWCLWRITEQWTA